MSIEINRSVDSKEFRKAMIDADCETFGLLEERTGIDRTTLSNIRNNVQKPNYDTIAKISNALHLKYAEIGRIFFCNELATMEEN